MLPRQAGRDKDFAGDVEFSTCWQIIFSSTLGRACFNERPAPLPLKAGVVIERAVDEVRKHGRHFPKHGDEDGQ
jgi:hypothetical protein